MSLADLTPNAIVDIHRDANPSNPVVQVLALKRIPSQDESKPERWRLTVSDGTTRQQSTMLATQLNTMVTSGTLRPNALIRLTKYLCNTVSGRRIVIVLNLDIVLADAGGVLGNPVNLREDGEPAAETGRETGRASPHMVPPSAVPGPLAPSAPAFHPPQQTTPIGGAGARPMSNPYARPPALVPVSAPSAAYAARPAGGIVGHQPISSLNPYNQKWAIRARVTSKGAVRKFTNAKGEGQLLSVDLIDESEEIRATMFGEAVNRFKDVLQAGKTFLIRNGRIKPANKKFSSLKNDYELTIDENTVVEEVADDQSVPRAKFAFVSLADLERAEPNSLVDIVAVCTEAGAPATITTKTTKKDLTKRELLLVDPTGTSVTCTLWGAEAEAFDHVLPAVVVMKAARVSDFSGRSLSAGPTVLVNPDLPEAVGMLAWYGREGSTMGPPKKLTVRSAPGSNDPRVTLSDIKDMHLGTSDRTDYFQSKGMITFVKKDNCFYRACDGCQKKLIEEGSGFRCEKCNTTTSTFKWRLMFSLNIADASGSAWVSAFQDSGAALFGKDPHALGVMREQDPPAFEAAVRALTFSTWVWRCRAKEETWNEEKRVKVSAMSATPLDYAAESHNLIAEIKKYL